MNVPPEVVEVLRNAERGSQFRVTSWLQSMKPKQRQQRVSGSRSVAGSLLLRLNVAAHKGAILAIVLAFLSGCTRTYTVTREMSWADGELSAFARPLPAGAIRLTFLNSPKYHVVLESPALRRYLEQAQKRSVTVTFRVRRHLWTNTDTFSIVAVDGRFLVDEGLDSYMESLGATRHDPGPFDGIEGAQK